MRKFFEKFTTIIQAVISTLFVLFIVLLLAGALDSADFKNNVVYILFGTFIAMHVVFTILSIYFQYSSDILTSVGLYAERTSVARISTGAIRKIIRIATKPIKGTKITHSAVYYDDNGLVLNNTIKVAHRELNGAIEEVKNTIVNVFREKVSLEFVSVNFKITSYKYQMPTVPQAPADNGTAVNAIAGEEAGTGVEAVGSADGNNLADSDVVLSAAYAEKDDNDSGVMTYPDDSIPDLGADNTATESIVTESAATDNEKQIDGMPEEIVTDETAKEEINIESVSDFKTGEEESVQAVEKEASKESIENNSETASGEAALTKDNDESGYSGYTGYVGFAEQEMSAETVQNTDDSVSNEESTVEISAAAVNDTTEAPTDNGTNVPEAEPETISGIENATNTEEEKPDKK